MRSEWSGTGTPLSPEACKRSPAARIDDLATHAGALTYGSFLAIPPLLLFASSIVGFVGDVPGRPVSDAGRAPLTRHG